MSDNVNREVYKKNFELLIRNKTLSVLRKLYDISISTLEVNEICSLISKIIQDEMKFPVTFICLNESDNNKLQLVGRTDLLELKDFALPLDNSGSVLITALTTKSAQITSNTLDIFGYTKSQYDADKFANDFGVKTWIIYPLVMQNLALGVFVVGLGKAETELSLAERQTLDELVDVIGLAIDRAQLHEKLKKANDHLMELDKMKDEFISIASHELRNPAAVVKDYIWTVLNEDKQMAPEVRSDLEKAALANQRLVQLVNDLLDVSRIEGGRLEIRPEEFDLASLIEEVLGEKKVTQTFHLSRAIVKADRDKIRQVVSNLLDNAIKYSDGQLIGVELVKSKSETKVTIVDAGIGIDPEQEEKLFTKFGRLDTLKTKIGKVGGTGLGLYICKKIIELSGGEIGFQSRYGQGSCFWFTLKS